MPSGWRCSGQEHAGIYPAAFPKAGKDLAPACAAKGAFVLTTRGGDFEPSTGQDASIGYLPHTDSIVQLYLRETFVFLILATEASVALSPPQKPS